MQHSTVLAAIAVAPLIALLYHLHWRLMSRSSTLQRIDVRDASMDTPPITGLHPDAGCSRIPRIRSETIVHGDMLVDGCDRFIQPLKVTGDLFVAGSARFDGPVTVNGYVHVRRDASAAFDGGLIAKADVLADGRVTVGRGDAGWCIARTITGPVACGDDEIAVLKAA